MAKSFVFTPEVSDLVTFARLRSGRYLEKGKDAFIVWADGREVCERVASKSEKDPALLMKKDGVLEFDSPEEAAAEISELVAAKEKEGFKVVELTTSGEPAEFLSQVKASPGDALSIARAMSARYFESKKAFRVIWPEGTRVFDRQGKPGTFDADTMGPDDDDAGFNGMTSVGRNELIARLVTEALGKGFVEKPLPGQSGAKSPAKAHPPPHLAAWTALATAKNTATAFATHFAFLAASAECKAVLTRVAARVTGLSVVDGQLRVTFRSGHVLEAGAPWVKPFEKSVPAGCQRFASVHNKAQLRKGPRSTLGFFGVERGALAGSDIDLDWLEGDSKLAAKFAAKEMVPDTALSRRDDYVIYNPFKKTSAKEPMLLFLSHEGGAPEPVFGGDLGVRGVFLRYLAEDVLG